MAGIVGSVGREGRNQAEDVRAVQILLNKNIGLLSPLVPLTVDGVANLETIHCIEEFQRRVVRLANPDGRVDPDGRTLRALNSNGVGAPLPGTPEELEAAPWIAIARAELGQIERPGRQQNPRILEYIATFPYLQAIPSSSGLRLGEEDETPWCACFVNWCLLQAGKAAGPSAAARKWLDYGDKLTTPRFGCICVVYHAPGSSTSGTTSSGNHVAFWTGEADGRYTLLGGNQGNKVSETTFNWTVLGYRWPR